MALRRIAGITLVALALWTGATGVAQADSDSSIPVTFAVYGPSGLVGTDSVTIGQLESSGCPLDPDQQPPVTYAAGGVQASIQWTPSQSWTLATIMSNPKCLDQTTPIPASFSWMTVIHPDSQEPDLTSAAQLTPQDVSDPSSGPALSDLGTQVVYVPPNRGPSDDNFQDTMYPQPGQSLVFDVFADVAQVTPEVVASATSVPLGGSVTFSIPAAPAGESYQWSWNFGDGEGSSSGATTTVTFPATAPGVYSVTVQAIGSTAGFTTVSVTDGSVPTGTGTTTTPTGPVKSSGETPGGSPGKRKRPTSGGRHKRTESTTAQTRVGKTGNGAGTDGSGPNQSGSSGSVHTGAVSGTAHRGKLPPASGPAAARQKAAGIQVSGLLLTALPARATPGGGGSNGGAGNAPRLNRPGGSGPWPLVAGVLALAALLSLGAARELRYIRFAR